MRLEGKIALVTGAGQGVGRAAAWLFSREGAAVVCADRDAATGEETVAHIKQQGGDALFVRTDTSRPDEVREMAWRCEEHYGKLHILFNADGDIHWATLEELEIEDLNRLLAVNLNGPILCSKYLLPAMKAAGKGAIIHNASIDAVRGNPRVVAYSVSKGGLIPLTHVMAWDMAKYNIRVNCLCPAGISSRPGGVHLGMFDDMQKSADGKAIIDGLIKATPLKRLGYTEELAAAALFLASDEASYITGTVLMVDGGRSAITPGTM